MFYVNRVRLDLKNINYKNEGLKSSEEKELVSISQEVLLAMKRIKKEKKQVVFEVPTGEKVNATGELEPLKGVFIPFISTRMGDFGEEEWIYTTRPLKENEELQGDEYGTLIQGERSLNPAEQYELIYFLRHVSKHVEKGYIKERDEEKDAAEFFDEGSKLMQLKMALKGITAKATVDNLARAWSVDKPEDHLIHMVKKSIYDKVSTYENNKKYYKRGIDEFLDNLAVGGEDVEVRVLISKAYDQGKIIQNPVSKDWHYSDGMSGIGKLICPVLPGHEDRGLDVLADHYVIRTKEFEILRRVVKGITDHKLESENVTADDFKDDNPPTGSENLNTRDNIPEESILSSEEIEALPWPEFLKKCPVKEKGKKTKSILTDEWLEMLQNSGIV